AVSALILGDGVFVPFVNTARSINYRLRLGSGAATGGYLAFFLFVTLVAILLVLVFRMVRPLAPGHYVISYLGGFLAITAAPLCWFYIAHTFSWYPVETAICILLAVTYLFSGRAISLFVAIALAALHYAFWCYRFWEYNHNPAELL